MSRYGDDPIDFGPIEDDYRSYDHQGEETARGPLILALAAGVLIVFGAVVWNTYRQGVRADSGDLPLITAQAEPYKRRPDDAGGARVPDQELRFYDEIDGSTRGEEQPIEGLRRSVSAQPEDTLAGGAGDALPAPATGSEGDYNAQTGLSAPRRTAQSEGRQQIAVLDEATQALAAAQDTTFDVPVVAVAPDQNAMSAMFEFAPSGAYLVQVAALRDEARAESTWEYLSGSYPRIFAGAEKRIQRADLGARGVFYRLRVGAFDSRTAASEFCEALKSTGNDCIIVQ
ncbi:MAG: SPOR domain-containing protein [Pseudomonadota bacterium]